MNRWKLCHLQQLVRTGNHSKTYYRKDLHRPGQLTQWDLILITYLRVSLFLSKWRKWFYLPIVILNKLATIFVHLPFCVVDFPHTVYKYLVKELPQSFCIVGLSVARCGGVGLSYFSWSCSWIASTQSSDRLHGNLRCLGATACLIILHWVCLKENMTMKHMFIWSSIKK